METSAKETYDKVAAQDRIVGVGTKPGTSLPEDEEEPSP